MKKKLLVVFLAIISVFALAFGLTACGGSNGGVSSSVNGTYYLYENGNYDKSQYITISGGNWSDDDDASGTYTLNGESIVFYAEIFGSNEEMFSGTLSDGTLTISVFGANKTYCKEGKAPSGDNGGNGGTTHTHTWATAWSSDDEYHWHTCSGCDEKQDYSQHYYTDGVCICGKEQTVTPIEPEITEYDVTFNLNYEGSSTVTKSTEDKLVTYVPSRTDYEFNGWYMDSDLTLLWDDTQEVTQEGLVLYASWVEAATEVGQLPAPVISLNGNVFSWKSIAGATGYRVIVTLSGATENVVDKNTANTSWTFPETLDAGVYKVKIRAVGDGVTTVNSVYVSRNYSLRVLNSVTGITLDRATSVLSWNSVENAEEYNIYIGNKLIATQAETSLDLSNYDAGSLTVKITATKENWLTSSGSATLNKLRLKTPEVLVTIDPDTNSYILSWKSILYADKYILKYGENEIEISGTTYTIDSDSAIWNGQNTATFTVNAFDSKADYLISVSNNEITIKKVFTLNIESSINEAGSVSLTGKVWKPVVVSFDLNGASGSVASQTVTTENGLVYPDVPTRSGYIFTGWYTEKTCENIYDFTAKIEKSIILYAGWYKCSGTFVELNSGAAYYSSSTSKQYYYFRALSSTQIKISYNQTTSSPTSYLMVYDVTKGETEIEEFSFKNTTPGSVSIYPVAGHVYYFRIYSSTSVKLSMAVSTYSSIDLKPYDGGKAVVDYVISDSSNDAVNSVINGEEYTLIAETKVGYTWVGWYDGETLLTNELSYTFTTPVKDVTYTAKWCKVTLASSLASAGSVSSLTETYKTGDEVTVTATTNSGYTFVGWYNGETLLTNELTYTFTMPSDNVTYTAKWIKVTIARSSTSAGSVTSLNGTYKVGDEVTVTATTNNGYTWVGWYKGETELTKELSYTFAMPSEDVTYTAKWVYYTLTTSRNNTSAGTVSSYSSTKITAGNEVTLTATTNSGYTFVGWYNGETLLSTELSYTFAMPAETVTYTATWAYYTLTTSRNNTSAGTITSYSNTKITAGNEITVTATTKSGYTWVGWYNGETLLSTELSYTFAMPSENITYTAKWCKVTLATSSTSAGTVSSLTGTYKVGDEVTITATTNSGYTWLGWYNGETELTKELSYTFTMPSENITYTAKWCKVSLVSSLTSAGRISSLTGTYKVGDEVTVTATTNSGYTWLGWYNGTTKLTNELSYTFTIPSEDVTYTAKWTYYTLTTSSNNTSAGTVSSYSNKKITAGQEITVLATSKNLLGYEFLGWYNGSTLLTNEFSYTFNMPTASITYTAKWGVDESLNNFIFTSTPTTCIITGITDKTVTEIVVPDYVSSISAGAFSGCSNLESITLPFVGGSIKTASDTYQYPLGYIFGTSSYTGGTRTSQIYRGSSTSSSTSTTYYIPTSLKKVIVTGGNILFSAFRNCANLTSVAIGNSITSIGTYAFRDCTSLISVTIGNNVTSIDGSAFWGSSLTTVNWNAIACTSAGTSSDPIFRYCTNLTTVNIGDNVQIIPSYAFENCSKLTSVTIGNSLESVGSYAFEDCSSLTDVYISDLEAWCKISFKDSYANPLAYAHNLYLNNQLVTQLIIPDSVESIGEYAFYGCSSLTSVTIPDNVTSIGNQAFLGCLHLVEVKNISSLTIETGSSNYGYVGWYAKRIYTEGESYLLTDENGYIIYDDGTAKILVGYVGTETELVLPSNITQINQYAFYKCSDLTSISIPDSVTSIGSSAFYGCSSLTSVTIPDNVTSIGTYAFCNCSSLTSITIPDSVTSIGNDAFYGCSSLTSVTIPDSVTSIGNNAFYNCSKLTNVTFENTNGWLRVTTSTATSISSADLADPATAAKYLKSTYSSYNWERS